MRMYAMASENFHSIQLFPISMFEQEFNNENNNEEEKKLFIILVYGTVLLGLPFLFAFSSFFLLLLLLPFRESSALLALLLLGSVRPIVRKYFRNLLRCLLCDAVALSHSMQQQMKRNHFYTHHLLCAKLFHIFLFAALVLALASSFTCRDCLILTEILSLSLVYSPCFDWKYNELKEACTHFFPYWHAIPLFLWSRSISRWCCGRVEFNWMLHINTQSHAQGKMICNDDGESAGKHCTYERGKNAQQ